MNPLVVVTASTPESTKRWRTMLASEGVRVHRPGESVDPADVPAIAVHIDSHLALLHRAVPDDRTRMRKELRRRIPFSDAWLRKHADDAEGCMKHRACRDAAINACEAGWGIPGEPADLSWVEDQDPDQPVAPEFMAAAVCRSISLAAARL
ncbi:hypothetical protein [Mycolicibacterium mageritense]|uniref:hypothetical protein n=1 Tax=Mycolicibacterium mageritense TaxID=53462 RepID=UPI0011DB03A2|nr:hypothetical protein [Mycolicibacterium mageritense]TXI59720.1 MAG: hypothetical protein E6Q55_21175 [Mycolicibacterium mageritense]